MGYVPFFNLYWCKKQLNLIFILNNKEFITDLIILKLEPVVQGFYYLVKLALLIRQKRYFLCGHGGNVSY